MASIRQTIPHYTGGISQQPDEKKLQGQVVEAKNVLPDVTQGLLKRPGGRLITSLSDNGTAALNAVTTTSKWFHYYRDENEQYIGQVDLGTGDINMWSCIDGSAKTVNYDGNEAKVKEYLRTQLDSNGNETLSGGTITDTDVQTLTLNDYTYFVNRNKNAAMATTVETVRPHEAFVELKQIKYSSQYGLEIYNSTATSDLSTITTATRLNVTYDQNDSGSSQAVKTNGTCDSVGTQTFGPSETNETGKTNLAFRITTNGQPTTEGNSTSPIYKCRYMVKCDLLYGGEGWAATNPCEVVMTTPIHDSKYTVTVAESSESKVSANLCLCRPTPTPFDGDTVVTAESIIGNIRTEILDPANSAVDSGSTGFTVEQIGTGLYIKRTDGAFNVSTPSGELLNVLSDSVQDVAALPKQCKHGYIVKVRNSVADEDDYYVKFFGKNNKDGPGTWEECRAPGRTYELNPDTMPVQMVREANGTFTVKQVAWADVLVGDSVTASEPSFIGKKINRMLFFRNRMVLLSDENIIMSQPGDFFNFWPKSAITFTMQDVIDISCSSDKPAIVYDGVQVNAGLVLFTKTQQFMLTTDSDILSPTTAKINALSNYNFNYKTNPINLGTTIGFLDNAGKYSRFWEVSKVLREGEPDVVDQTKVVSKLFDNELELVSNSRENSVVFFSKKNSSTLYGFRYFTTNQRRMQQAWFKWELSGDIQHHAVLDDALFVVVKNGTKFAIQKFAIKIDDSGHTITDDKGTTADTTDDLIHRIHLDNSTAIASGNLTLVTDTNGDHTTTFTLPAGFNAHQTGTYTRSGTTITVSITGHGYAVGDSVIFNAAGGGATNGTYTVQTVANANTFTITDTVSGTISSNNCHTQTKQLAVFAVPTSTDKTFQGNAVDVTLNGTTVSIPGNWKTYLEDENDPETPGDPTDDTTKTPANNIILGYQFDMEVQFPTIYNTQVSGDQTKADMQSNLVIHRLKLNFGPAGLYQTIIDRVGKPSFTDTWEPTLADSYSANRVQVNKQITQTIPVYERNNNLTVTLKSTHPTPATLYSMTWEGDYTTNYYQRV